MPQRFDFRSRLYHLEPAAYEVLLLPLAKVKHIYQLAYDLLLSAIWQEFSPRVDSRRELFSTFTLAIFGLLSLLTYYTEEYNDLIFGVFVLTWLIDVAIARRRYFDSSHSDIVTLRCRENWLAYERMRHNRCLRTAKFKLTQVAQISVMRTQIHGGAFDEPLGQVWQVSLSLRDYQEFLVCADRNPTAALNVAKQLACCCQNCPIVVLGSEGQGRYAAGDSTGRYRFYSSKSKVTLPSSLQVEMSPTRWHLFAQWQGFKSTWRLLKTIVRQSGFFMFLLVMTNLMTYSGALMHVCWLLWFQPEIPRSEVIHAIAILQPNLDLSDLVEWGTALGLVLHQAWQASQEKHLFITQQCITFCLNRRPIHQLPTTAIETTLFIPEPKPLILLVGSDTAVEITDLQAEEDFRDLLNEVDKALNHFQNQLQPV